MQVYFTFRGQFEFVDEMVSLRWVKVDAVEKRERETNKHAFSGRGSTGREFEDMRLIRRRVGGITSRWIGVLTELEFSVR